MKRFNISWLALILAVGILARLSILIAFPSVFAFDQTGAVHGSAAYDTYARNLLATGVYGITPGKADASVPPLYSYVLAGVYAIFGRGYMQVGLFHILLDVLSILMLVEIGKRLFPNGQTVGLLTGLLYALYPYLIFQNLTLIDTPFFMFLLHAFVLLMILLRDRVALDRGTWVIAGLGGVVLGASMLVRPIMPPLALLIAVWFLFKLNLAQTIVRLLPVALVGALILIPWILRNYGVYHAFVPMTTTSGANFWQGNSPYTVPYFRAGYDVQWTSPPDFNRTGLGEREADAHLFSLAFQYLRENPGKIPELLWTKFLVHWSIDIAPRRNPVGGVLPRVDYQGNVLVETDNSGGLELNGLPPGDPVAVYSDSVFDQVGRIVHRLYYGGLFLLALGGIVLTARQRRNVSLLWFVQIAMTVVYLIFHPSTRYRVPSDPMLFLFSAYLLIALWNYGKSRNVRWKQPILPHDQPAA
ncbi:MAG: glycosyltransferase family 39 protein [Anaerolineae bacterium]|nr:glycosyltransferase family 39 protein [Anaerolineae bacterium]